MNISIYVVTLDQHIFPRSSIYKPIYTKKNAKKGALHDGLGETICEKNKYYGDLTRSFWVWKNDHKSDIVGFCQYRRYLQFCNLKKYDAQKICSGIDDCNELINTKGIERYLNEYDIILPVPYVFSKETVETQYCMGHRKQDFLLMKQTIKKMYPDYVKSMEYVCNQRYLYVANMFVMKKNDFDGYMEWLFSILNDMEKNVMLPKDPVQYRVFGFLAERLLNIYVYHNKLKKKEVPMLFINGQNEKGSVSCEKNIYKDFRYLKRRYFPWMITVEESIRSLFKGELSS